MKKTTGVKVTEKKLSIFERYLTVWVLLCIVGGIILGKIAPDAAATLNEFSVYQVSVPIAVCLFFMMYPIMVKIDFSQVLKSAKTPKPVFLTLFINWAIKPFTMFAIAYFFLGYLFVDYLPGTEILKNGEEVELWRSYVAGAILLGIAPCTAMVLMWGAPGKRERRLNTGNGSNKFTDNACYFWTFRKIVIEHKFHTRTMGNYAVYSISLCCFPADCRLPVKEMDSSIQRSRVVQ
jgi:hypothetical protein